MEHEAVDGRCNNWNHVWMQGCQTCVEDRARQQALLDAVEAVKAREADFMRITEADPDSWACRVYGDALAAIEALGGER